MNEIDDYLHANRDRFTRTVLTQRLIDEGNDPAAVEAAWARVEAEHAAGRALPGHGAGAGTMLLGILLALAYGAAIVLAFFAISIGGAVAVLMIAYIVTMSIGGFWSIRQLVRAPTRERGVAVIAVAGAVSILVFVGLSGLCVALLGPATNASGRILL